MRLFAGALALLLAAPSLTLRAQDAAARIAAGDSAWDRYDPVGAVRGYEAALALDSTLYAANWKAARSLVDIAKQMLGNADSLKRRRDSIYSVARGYAERALRIDSTHADGHFALALALGQLSRTRGGKERVRFARIIFDEATRAVQIDSTHDGAHHILGAWHAEVKRLSGITKFFAKTLYGAGFMNQANWDDAVSHLTRAVAQRPGYVYHRLELAEVYVDLDQYTKARELLESIPPLPQSDPMDAVYQHDAADLLKKIAGKKDRAA